MRVVAGIAKGHKLYVPSGQKIRPTADRVKEALFSILGPKVVDSMVLDLFAGSGALGIEALSRGASRCVFIDHSKISIDVINKNLKKTGLDARTEVLYGPVAKALDELIARGQQFDLIFLDPPYRIKLTELTGILETLSREKLIKVSGTVALEHSVKVILREINGLSVVTEKRYGDTGLTFLSLA